LLRKFPAETWLSVFSFMPFHTLIMVKRSCRRFHELAEAHAAVECRVETLLGGFLDGVEVSQFLSLQIHTGLVIAGTFVLRFLLRQPNLLVDGECEEMCTYVNEKFSDAAIAFFLNANYEIIENLAVASRTVLPGMAFLDNSPHEVDNHVSQVVSLRRNNHIVRLLVVRLHSSIMATILAFRSSASLYISPLGIIDSQLH
jgi:hypothetical protein